MEYKETITIKVTEDIPKMIEDFTNYMKKEYCYKMNRSEAIRTMIFQRWSQLPREYQNNFDDDLL